MNHSYVLCSFINAPDTIVWVQDATTLMAVEDVEQCKTFLVPDPFSRRNDQEGILSYSHMEINKKRRQRLKGVF